MIDLPPQRILSMEGGGLKAELYEAANRASYFHSAFDSYPAEEMPEELLERAWMTAVEHGESRTAILVSDDAVASVRVSNGYAWILAYGKDRARAQAWLDEIKAILPEVNPPEGTVQVTFWSYGQHGPISRPRQLEVAAWEDIEPNYGGETHAKLAQMMDSAFAPAHGGQLLLWSGPAGTGKTHALRALARAWKTWCSVHYIVDPDKFFGTQSDYFTEVLLGGEDKQTDDGKPPQWRLLVLEDSGELLRADAAEVTGKALARLLNTVDGLIGQGLRIMVLITTNEELGALHPAVSRPGRCAVEIEFEKLDAVRAADWREARGLESLEEAATLAELYAELEGFAGARSKVPVGFAT